MDSSYMMKTEEDNSLMQPCKFDSKSPKRLRTAFTPDQRKILELSFKRNSLPSSHDLEDIAQKLGLKPKIVRTWFQNKRTQARKKLNKFPNRDFHSTMNSMGVPANLSESMKMIAPPNVSLNPMPTQLPFKITSAFNQSSPLMSSRGLWNPFLYEPPRPATSTSPAPNYYNGGYAWPPYYTSWNNVPGNSIAGPDYPPFSPMTPSSFSASHQQESCSYSPGTSPYSTPNMNSNYSHTNYLRDNNFFSYGVSSPSVQQPSMSSDISNVYADSRVPAPMNAYYAPQNSDQTQCNYFSDTSTLSSHSGNHIATASPNNYSNYQWEGTAT